MTARPRRADVAAVYDLGVDAYETVWSPVILPPAQAVVAALALRPRSCVLDVGTGTGALIPSIRAAAPAGTVVGLDAAAAMLRTALARTPAPVVLGDALALPFRDATADAAVLAFVLFHLDDPLLAVTEAARVLRRGGRVGTVTWMREGALDVYRIWDETLSEAGAPPLPSLRVDNGLDSPDRIEALLTAAGLQPTRIWLAPLSYQWEPSTYWRLATGSGVNRARLQRIDAETRGEVLARARERLDALEPEAFAWWGEVVCAVATKRG